MKSDIEQPCIASRVDFRHARQRLGIEHAIVDHAQAPTAFGDQHVAVGKKRQAPGMRNAARDHRHANLRLLGRGEYERSRTEGRSGKTDWGLLSPGRCGCHRQDQQNPGHKYLHVSEPCSVFTNNMIPARYCALLAFVVQVAAAESRPVEGVVVNPVTKAAIAGANVTFYTPQAVRYQVTTDASGAFKIAQMDLGDYRALVEKDGFAVFPLRPSESKRAKAVLPCGSDMNCSSRRSRTPTSPAGFSIARASRWPWQQSI